MVRWQHSIAGGNVVARIAGGTAGAALAASLLFAPAAAAADLQLGVDLDAIFPAADALAGDTGFGVSARVGAALPATPIFDVVPELQVGYVDLGAPEVGDAVDAGDLDLDVVRVMVGARIAFGEILRPTAFGHIGYGRLNLSDDDVFFERRGGLADASALAWDLGLALDLAILPLIDVGVHGAWNVIETDETLDWWSAGVHANLTF